MNSPVDDAGTERGGLPGEGTWRDRYERLAASDRAAPLTADQLELLGTAAYMLGREDEYLVALERAHRLWLGEGAVLRAVRCAFWVGLALALGGETARASGWLGRAGRLLERDERDCAERGYLLLAVAMRQEANGELHAWCETARAAADVGERFGDPDLTALAVHEQGRALTKLGRVQEGLALLDEAMVAVAAEELSPIVTGLLYCSVIDGCQEVFAARRAAEWTAALTRWCERQPDMVAFTGRCLVHRAELMQLRGAWTDALREARRAGGRPALSRAGRGQAHYREGELHRLRGDLEAAREAYRNASRDGFEPQPGLALLSLAAGEIDAAATAARRVLDETVDDLRRLCLLPAYVEIMLAAGELEDARSGCEELENRAAVGHEDGLLDAIVAQARGALDLAGGDARTGLIALRRAADLWQNLDAPYETARVRVLIGSACRELGDDHSGELELEAARDAFDRLGAVLDVARVDALRPSRQRVTWGLTARELEVLRLVAAGATNKAIAGELVVSGRTVDRHVSNIFRKLRVRSRAAATAFAYEHDLV